MPLASRAARMLGRKVVAAQPIANRQRRGMPTVGAPAENAQWRAHR